ncbi:hypothetical protein ACMFMF_011658 [Clarireedia jacksonii]
MQVSQLKILPPCKYVRRKAPSPSRAKLCEGRIYNRIEEILAEKIVLIVKEINKEYEEKLAATEARAVKSEADVASATQRIAELEEAVAAAAAKSNDDAIAANKAAKKLETAEATATAAKEEAIAAKAIANAAVAALAAIKPAELTEADMEYKANKRLVMKHDATR